ncbi:MAG: hypothetical protein M3220_15130 [Chloroflexota bacterium]|nr:hypothetical protein [Chloroflexota bacterium]
MGTGESSQDDRAYYQIRIQGALDPRWSAWFDNLTISYDANGDTALSGFVADQAALYGLISRARDLGLTLIAVMRDESGSAGSD